MTNEHEAFECLRDGSNQRISAKVFLDGNENAEAMWIFSSDACGIYGLEHIHIAHAGRTEPLGVITISSDRPSFKISSGAGILLRVNENAK